MSKVQLKSMQRDITRWLAASSKLKVTSSIQYGKLKSAMTVFETKASSQEIADLAGELGTIFFVQHIFNLRFRKHR